MCPPDVRAMFLCAKDTHQKIPRLRSLKTCMLRFEYNIDFHINKLSLYVIEINTATALTQVKTVLETVHNKIERYMTQKSNNPRPSARKAAAFGDGMPLCLCVQD